MSLKGIALNKLKEGELIFIGWLATNRVALIINGIVFVIAFYLGHRWCGC
jgi:uncharacterized membrane protein (Fun14 family)